MFILNVFLAIAWAAVTGELTLSNLLTGFVIAYAVLWLVYRSSEHRAYFAKVLQVIRFSLVFLAEMVLATVRVAVDVLTPTHQMKPAVLAIEVQSESEAEATMLANAITLTPGTLVLDISPDGRTFYVHAMYAHDIEATRQSIQEVLGRQVREVFQ